MEGLKDISTLPPVETAVTAVNLHYWLITRSQSSHHCKFLFKFAVLNKRRIKHKFQVRIAGCFLKLRLDGILLVFQTTDSSGMMLASTQQLKTFPYVQSVSWCLLVLPIFPCDPVIQVHQNFITTFTLCKIKSINLKMLKSGRIYSYNEYMKLWAVNAWLIRDTKITDLNTSNEKQTSALVRCSLIVTTFSLSRIVKRKFWR